MSIRNIAVRYGYPLTVSIKTVNKRFAEDNIHIMLFNFDLDALSAYAAIGGCKSAANIFANASISPISELLNPLSER